MSKLTKYCMLFSACCFALSSCSDKVGADDERNPYLMEISVSKTTRAEADSDDGEKAPAYDGEDIFDVEFIPDKSILYISQKTRFFDPFSTGVTTYKYVYYDNPYASWDENFNFKALVEDDLDPDVSVNPNALEWEEVGRKGSVGNGFALYAMYYPDQKNGTRTVAVDQSLLEDLQRSDILGAYHSTSALYSRVRFQLHHLMVYFKINLYVPVFGETWKTETKEPENQGFSGYTTESLTDAWIMNVCPRFTVDWAANISSESSLGVSLPDNYTKDELRNIRMYSHAHEGDEIVDETLPDPDKQTRADDEGDGPVGGDEDDEDDDDPAGGEGEVAKAIRPVKKTRIDISQFLPKDLLDIQPMDPAEDGKIYDDVLMYSFSVIVPAQYADFTSQNPGFLRFAFKKPGTYADKFYSFSSGFSSNSSSSVLEPNKGSLQVLNLYLPRKGDEIILVGAEIQDWTDVDTDITLPHPEDKKESDTND